MNVTSNGHAKNTALTVVDNAEFLNSESDNDSKVKPKRERKPAQNPYIEVKMTIDAGSESTKIAINGEFFSYPTTAREVKEALSSNILGCFSVGTKNYVVGYAAETVAGDLIEGFKSGNKVKSLPIWILGALTNHPSLLDKANEDRKHKKQSVRIKLYINILTLSQAKKAEIDKMLLGIKTFKYNESEFELEIKPRNGKLLYPEGYGSAVAAQSKTGDSKIYVLDLGGGTLTLSTFAAGIEPKAMSQSAASGSGFKALVEYIAEKIIQADVGGVRYRLDSLSQALRTAKEIIYYRHDAVNVDITETAKAGFDDWVRYSPGVSKLLTQASQLIIQGQKVHATGGGFASPIVAIWLKRYVTNGLDESLFDVLDNPATVNVTGIESE